MCLGLISADGEFWQQQRRFLLNHRFGLESWGRKEQELRIRHEVLDALNALAIDCKLSLDLSNYLSASLANIICSIIMSTRFRHGDFRLNRFIEKFDEGLMLYTDTRCMFSMSKTVEKLKQHRESMLAFVGGIVDDHKQCLDRNKPQDLVDNYLVEIEQCREQGTTEQTFGSRDPETQLKQILLDIFSAGVEPVKTTLLWTFIHVLRNPEVKVINVLVAKMNITSALYVEMETINFIN